MLRIENTDPGLPYVMHHLVLKAMKIKFPLSFMYKIYIAEQITVNQIGMLFFVCLKV